MLLGTLEELAARLRAAADALDEVEADWLRGAADLVERAGPERQAARAEAVWLEELASEAKARKASLLSAWVDAAESLRSAIHVHETERGPLVEALFPVWKGASLRRHVDQALAAQTELQRRLGSAYVLRRLAELTTQSAVGPALEALAAAGAAWAAERERPALSGGEADTVRARLLGAAANGAQLLERVRSVVRAALVSRPELAETVFPKRGRPAALETPPESGAAEAPAAETVPAAGTGPGAPDPADRPAAVEATPSPKAASGRRKKGAPDEASVVGTRSASSPGRTLAASPVTLPDSEAARAPRRRPLTTEPAPPGGGTSPHPARRGLAISRQTSTAARTDSAASRSTRRRPATTVPAPSDHGSLPHGARRSAAEPKPAPTGRRKKRARGEASVVTPARTTSPRRGPAAPPVILPDSEAVRAPRRRPVAAEPVAPPAPTPSERGTSARGSGRSAAEPRPAPERASGRGKKSARGEASVVVPASPTLPRGRQADAQGTLPDSDAARAPRRRPLAAEPAPSERGTSARGSGRSAAEPRPAPSAPSARAALPSPVPRGGRRPSRPSRRS
jgi:hypothetical protein